MQISENDWIKYKNKLASISDKAADEMVQWLQTKGGYQNVSRSDLIDYAYALSTKYGEASASLSALMYDEIAEKSGVVAPSAEVADTATYSEVAKAINGVTKRLTTDKQVGSVVGRTVKQAGADTTLKNAERDGAEFAWVPSGDTCVFCLMLASNGWQSMSMTAMKNGHAEHIHANCDCTYAVRFDDKTTVKGYDPEKYKKIFENAEGDTWNEKINSVRRIQYQENKDKINAQKRANYTEKRRNISERQRLDRKYPNSVQIQALDAPGFVEKFQGITGIEEVDNSLYECAVKMLDHRNGTNYEDIYFIDAVNGNVIHGLTTCDIPNGVTYDEETKEKIKQARQEGRKIITIHNHPGGLPPSMDDGVSAYDNEYVKGVAVGHNLEVYEYTPTDNSYTEEQCREVHKNMNEVLQFTIEFDDSIWYNVLKEYGMEVIRR